MRAEKRIQIIKGCIVTRNKQNNIVNITEKKRQEITITDVYADEGKVLIEKATGKVLSDHITLGTEDSVENYDEIEKGVIA